MFDDYVLATLTPPHVFNFYATMDAAVSDLSRANTVGRIFGDATYAPMSYATYKAAERAFYLNRPATRITAETFDAQMSVLPPLHFQEHKRLCSFLMSEFWSGPYTEQYAYLNGVYCCKMVDATDPSTWITHETFATLS